ncbi:MAG TPA: hypothetical protein VMU61_02445 [Candidatus Aquilonibacter sp.]|nr:hypothetical protein [Candidatus Aquilonibacter sp.]
MASNHIRLKERAAGSGTQPDLFLQEVAPGAGAQAAPDQESAADVRSLTEEQVLALLERRDLTTHTLEQFSQNAPAMKSRKVCLALASHPHVPRHMALRLLRQFYTFDLMRFALQPAAAADLKRVADELLVARLASITLGERLTLARRASEMVAAALLLDKESRVSHTALENARLTEAAVVKALMRPNAAAALVDAVCHHAKWSLRREIRVALLRNRHTSLARALEFARGISSPQLRDILHTSRLPESVKSCLRKEMEGKR